MYGLMRRRSMMTMALPVPTERLIYSLTNYTCDGTVNTFIDTGIKLFGLEYDAFRIEMEYDGLDLSTTGLETLLECKSFVTTGGTALTPGLTVRVSNRNQYSPQYEALIVNSFPLYNSENSSSYFFGNASSASLTINYNKNNNSVTVNGETVYFSGHLYHTEPLTIGGRYSSHLSNPDRFVQVHISSLKIYATPSSIDPTYIYTPLTFKCLTGGDLSIKNSNGSYDRNFEYSLNGGAWTAFELPKNTASKLIATLSPNDTISFRRDNDNFADAQFISDSNLTFDIYGNLLSLQYGSAFNGQTDLINTSKKAFGSLFKETNVVDASKLMLTASTLSASCYYEMFHSCYRLIAAPALYATRLAEGCCRNMFRYCSSLKSLPKFYGTNLAKNCCNGMFGGTAIETIPSGYLSSATTMAESCYSSMFKGCTSLITVPGDLLPSTSLASSCYLSMFDGCTSLTTAPELPAITLVQLCYKSMFEYCTSLTTAPNLPATTLAKSCYDSMFKDCTNLVSVQNELPATTLANACYQSMFKGCTSLTAAPSLPATTLVASCYQYMFFGCTSLNYIKCLATDISAVSCTYDWVGQISNNNGTFIKNSTMSSWTQGSNGYPWGWTVVDAS